MEAVSPAQDALPGGAPRVGLRARLEWRVTADRTVPHLLPESTEFARLPAVLATGYLVGAIEWACIRTLDGALAPGQDSVGVHVDLSHESATPPGDTVVVEAELTAVEGRVLTFAVMARDGAAVISRGTHRRAVIDRERFDARLVARAATSS